MTFNEEMGKRLRECREYWGLSQKDIATFLGVQHRNTVTLIESGRQKVTVEQLKKLAKLYSKPIDYFLGEPDPEPFTELKTLCEGLPDEDRKGLTDFAAFLHWRKRSKEENK